MVKGERLAPFPLDVTAIYNRVTYSVYPYFTWFYESQLHTAFSLSTTHYTELHLFPFNETVSYPTQMKFTHKCLAEHF